ncbi:MAG: Uma2 family endonuclease [Armatimonadetes bacterium]|nr:Uma2 family endonuclease [Armatimonadota bacterium]
MERHQKSSPERYRFSTDDYERMIEAGILTEDERLELIEGEILHMSPIGKLHVLVVTRLTYLLIRNAGDRWVVWTQNPIRLSDSTEPQPDMALIRPREGFFGDDLPTPADVLLIIEVSDTTLEFDRTTKLRLYAEAGIPEFWIVDLTTDTIWVYARPEEGEYRDSRSFRRGDTVSSPTLPDLALKVEEILG